MVIQVFVKRGRKTRLDRMIDTAKPAVSIQPRSDHPVAPALNSFGGGKSMTLRRRRPLIRGY